jgi:hypothetical protein
MDVRAFTSFGAAPPSVIDTGKTDITVTSTGNKSISKAAADAAEASPVGFGTNPRAFSTAPDGSEIESNQKQAGSKAGSNSGESRTPIKTNFDSVGVNRSRADISRLADSLFTPLTPILLPSSDQAALGIRGTDEKVKALDDNAIAPIPSGIIFPIQALSVDKFGSDESFKKGIERVRDEVMQTSSLDRGAVASTIGVSASFTIGYVLWLVRGGVLISSRIASLPAWRMVDPLPVLNSLKSRDEENNDKSLQELVEAKDKTDEPEIETSDLNPP